MMCGTHAHGRLADALAHGGCGHLFYWDSLEPANTCKCPDNSRGFANDCLTQSAATQIISGWTGSRRTTNTLRGRRREAAGSSKSGSKWRRGTPTACGIAHESPRCTVTAAAETVPTTGTTRGGLPSSHKIRPPCSTLWTGMMEIRSIAASPQSMCAPRGDPTEPRLRIQSIKTSIV